jgi:hypothetical protein
MDIQETPIVYMYKLWQVLYYLWIMTKYITNSRVFTLERLPATQKEERLKKREGKEVAIIAA